MKRTKPRTIRATLRRRDGTCVRRVPLLDTDDFMFCLLTYAYYDREEGCTYVERNWDWHAMRVLEKNAATSPDVLDVPRAACGLPIAALGWANR